MNNFITEDDLNNPEYQPDCDFLKNSGLQILDINWLDKYSHKKQLLKPKEVAEIYSPHFEHEKASELTASPSIYMHIFNGYYGRVGGSNFHNNKEIIIERLPEIPINLCNYRAGNLILHGTSKALVHTPKKHIEINEPCLFLGGNGSFNYYHLLLEIIPKLSLFCKHKPKHSNINTIIANKKLLEVQQFADMLQIAIEKTKETFSIKYFGDEDILLFNEVYYITTPNNTLFNTKINAYKTNFTLFSKKILREITKTYIKEKKPALYSPKKIFLLRNKKYLSPHNKRDYNEEEILRIFMKHGFEPVLVENYSFKEQIYLFNNAEEIAGPTGAFWANLIFCKPGTRMTSWLTEQMAEFSCYSTLAMYYKCHMRFLKAKSKTKTIFHSSYHLEAKDVERFLK